MKVVVFILLNVIATLGFIAPCLSQAQVVSGKKQHLSGDNGFVVPRFVRFSGVVHGASRQSHSAVGLTFAIYDSSEGGVPLWLETQNVTPDENGRYSALLGSTKPEGLPLDIFSSGEARWLGIRASEDAGERRVLLVSVPYAVKAATADDSARLAGHPITDFQLNVVPAIDAKLAKAPAPIPDAVINNGASNGTPNFLAKFDSATTVVNSAVFEIGGNVGIGTANPSTTLDILAAPGVSHDPVANFGSLGTTDSNSIAVNNGSNTTNLFVAGTPGTFVPGTLAGDGGIRVRTGKAIVFGDGTLGRMNISGSGNVGIGTSSPAQKLDVTGKIRITGSGNGVIFPDGSVQTTAQAGFTTAVTGKCLTHSFTTAYVLNGLGQSSTTDCTYGPGSPINPTLGTGLSISGTLKNLQVVQTSITSGDAFGGLVQVYLEPFNQAGGWVQTSITCSLPQSTGNAINATTTCSDTSHTTQVQAGQKILVLVTPSNNSSSLAPVSAVINIAH